MKLPVNPATVAIAALDKELIRLQKREAKLDAEVESCMAAPLAHVRLVEECYEVMKSMTVEPKKKLALLDEMGAKEKKLIALMNKDLVKLMDRHSDAKFAADNFASDSKHLAYSLSRYTV